MRLTVGRLSQGTIHQVLLHSQAVRPRAHLQVLVWVLQYEAQRETAATACFLCRVDMDTVQISGLWVRALGHCLMEQSTE